MAGLRRDVGQDALHPVEAVDLELGAARLPVKLCFEETLDACPTDSLVGQVAVINQLTMLALRHRPHVPNDVRGDLVLRVGPHPVPLGLDPGDRPFGHPQQAVLIEARRDDLGGERVRSLVGEALPELGFRHVEQIRELGEDRSGLVFGVAGLVDRHDASADVVRKHNAVAIKDPPPGRRRDDDADLVGLRGHSELLGLEHLQVPQAREQRSEQAHDHDAHEGHPASDRLIHLETSDHVRPTPEGG